MGAMSGSHPDDDRLNREVASAIARLSSDQASMAAALGKVAEMAELADRTLRGSNGTVGVVAYVERARFDIGLLRESYNALAEAVEHLKAQHEVLHNSLDFVTRPGDAKADDGTKWKALLRFAEVLGIVSAVLLSLLNTLGVL